MYNIDDVIYFVMKYRKILGIDKKLTFGTEIEFENASYDNVGISLKEVNLLNNWRLEKDETVQIIYNEKIYGGEVVSPILYDEICIWKELKMVCQIIKQNIGLTDKKAGSHIHIGKQILQNNRDYLVNFVKLWCIYEHIIYRFAYGEKDKPRKTLDMYATACSYRLHESILEIDSNHKKYNDFNQVCDYLYDTLDTGIGLKKGLFFACSNNSDDKKDTIEIRCPNGTLNEIIWQNNIYFFIKLMLYAISNNFDKEFIDEKFKDYKNIYMNDYSNIYIDDAVKLCDLIFESEIDKLYFLKQYLKINKNNYKQIKDRCLVNIR